MDLRKYIKKRLNVRNVLNHEYSFYSYSDAKYSKACLLIIIERNEETPVFPGYELMIKLHNTGTIAEIMRLQLISGRGILTKKFPSSIEDKAKCILADIVTSVSHSDLSDLSLLQDNYKPDASQ